MYHTGIQSKAILSPRVTVKNNFSEFSLHFQVRFLSFKVELKYVFAKVPAPSIHEMEFKPQANTKAFKSRKEASDTAKAVIKEDPA